MAEWISVKDKMPEVETEVLIRAMWRCGNDTYSTIAAAFYEDGTVLDDDSCWRWDEIWEWGEYDEEKDGYKIPEGWWESCHYSDIDNNRINDEVTHWMPLPEYPAEEVQTIDHSADVGKIKTRQERFLEVFPHADTYKDVVCICPGNVDTRLVCNEHDSCLNCRKEYWFAKENENG